MADEPTAPVAEPTVDAPAESVRAPGEAEDNGQGTQGEASFEQLVSFFAEDPNRLDAFLRQVPADKRVQAPIWKEEMDRAEQRGRTREQRQFELRARDMEEHDRVTRDRDAALAALNAEELDPAERRSHAQKLRDLTQQAHDHDMKGELWGTIQRSPVFDAYSEEDMARLSRVDGRGLREWFREHLGVAVEAADRTGYARGLEAGRKQGRTELETELAAAGKERPSAPARPGAPGSTPLTFEQLEHLFATDEATPEQIDAYIQERHRRGMTT